MSDLKNVLKAGFLVTASLLATGCDDNKDKAATPSTPNNGGGSGGGNGSGGGSGGGGSSPSPQSPTVKKPIPTFKIDTAEVLKSLRDPSVGYTLVQPKAFKQGDSKDYDFFNQYKTDETQKLGVVKAPNSSNVNEKTIATIVGLQTEKEDSILFDSKNTKANNGDLGGLFLEGFFEKDKPRKVLTNKFNGAFTVDAFVLRNALAQGVGERASISSIYGYVGIDAAVGYPFLRENSKGEKVDVPDHVFSTPDTKPVQQLGLGLALHSKSNKQSQVANLTNDKNKAKENVLGQKKSDDTIKLVVGSNKSLDQIKRKNLEDAGLDLGKKDGALDIGGRVSNLETINAIVLPISDIQPTLMHIPGVDKEIKSTPKPEKKTNSLGLSNPFKSKKEPKAQVTSTQAKEKSQATAATPSIGQAIVKDSSGVQKFMFQIQEGEFFPEIGDWKVKAGSQLGILPHHSLVVHNLDLTESDLGLHVYVDEHTFVKATKDFDASLVGKELFNHLANDHNLSIETSPEVEESSGKVTDYAHFSSHTPFPLWVMDANVPTQPNTLKLEDITLAGDFKLEKGYYVMPLAKDFKKKIVDTMGNTPIAIGESKYEVTGWKVAGNGYFDKVLLINVEEKSQPTPSGLGLSSVLMSSKAQGRRSVASSKLDAVIAKLDPSNLVSASLANIASTHANQASQFATMARGSNAATSAKLGAVEQYAVSFNHEGVQFGLTYNLNGGNAFTSNSGTTAIGANVATNVLGLKAIVSAEASVDAGKNALVSTSVTSYSAGLTFAKAYNAAGLSVVPMAGFGVSSNAFSGYSAIVPMAYNALGLSMNNVSFSTATFHAGVNLALDDFVAKASGVNASLTLGVAGYLAANANAKLSTNEGASKHIAFEGSSATPYAQFNLGFATGETLNALISTGSVAVNFGFDR